MSKLFQIENRLFTNSRLCLWGSGAIFALGFCVARACFLPPSGPPQVNFGGTGWPYLPNGKPHCIDFGWMWLSGKFAVAGDLASVFNYPAFSDAQAAFFGPLLENCINFNRFYYPPTFLFFTYPFGLMPYTLALVVWIIASLALYAAAAYAIVPRRVALILAVSPAFVMQSNIFLGHNGLLTAALMGLSLAYMERRPCLAGFFLGLLTYKPNYGVLLPIALLASRNWRVISSAALAAVVLGTLAAMAFGSEGWVQFVDSLTDRNSSLGPAPWVIPKLQTVFGLFQLAGANTTICWIGQSVACVAVALGIWILWAQPISHNLKAAALCAGTLLVTPYALFYDLTIPCIAAAFLIKEGLSREFLPGERTTMFLCWALLLLPWRTGPVICLVLLFLIIRRVIRVPAFKTSPQDISLPIAAV
jgi:hypothetical protein